MKKFSKVYVVSFFLFLFSACSTNTNQNEKSNPVQFSILQGLTSKSSTEINVLVNKNSIPKVALYEKETGLQISESAVVDNFIDEVDWGVKSLKYINLAENKDYLLKVISSSGLILDQRELRTLNLTKKQPKLAIVSCTDDDKVKEQAIMWEGLLSQSPDMIFLIGDQVYADWKMGKKQQMPLSLKQVWSRYVDSRMSLDLYKSKRLVPTHAIWDDHDYGANDGDETNPIKHEMKKLFYAFYSQDTQSDFYKKGPGVSSLLSAFNQNFLFLDNRSFRTPNNKPVICDKKKDHKFCLKDYPISKNLNESVFGAETEKWVLDILNKSSVPNWLISGDQFFGAYHPFESYEGTHPNSFKKLLSKLRSTGKTIAFISGDRHLSEVMKIDKNVLGFETYEITSSGMHAAVFPPGWDEFPNPRQISGAGQTLNYTIIEPTTLGNMLKVKLEAYGPQKKLLYSQELQVR